MTTPTEPLSSEETAEREKQVAELLEYFRPLCAEEPEATIFRVLWNALEAAEERGASEAAAKEREACAVIAEPLSPEERAKVPNKIWLVWRLKEYPSGRHQWLFYRALRTEEAAQECIERLSGTAAWKLFTDGSGHAAALRQAEAAANAIIPAVNSHARLVSALELARSTFNTIGGLTDSQRIAADCDIAIRRIDGCLAALSQATRDSAAAP